MVVVHNDEAVVSIPMLQLTSVVQPDIRGVQKDHLKVRAVIVDIRPIVNVIGRDGNARAQILDHVELVSVIEEQVRFVTECESQSGKATHHFGVTGKSLDDGEFACHSLALAASQGYLKSGGLCANLIGGVRGAHPSKSRRVGQPWSWRCRAVQLAWMKSLSFGDGDVYESGLDTA
jgi:hypothetical protein